MGKLCSKQTQTTSSNIETEREISIRSFNKEEVDKAYELQENKYNYLRKINFADFIYSLMHFSSENATLEDDYTKFTMDQIKSDNSFYYELFSDDIFQSFLENKILKHKAIYEEAGNNEKISKIFKETFITANSGLGLKISQEAKNKGDETADRNTAVKKIHVVAFGILYCMGANYVKVKSLFNMFQEGGSVKPSSKLNEFLLALALIPSYCMASARNKLSKYDEFEAIDKEKLKSFLDSSELKDCENLVEVMNKKLFGQNKNVTLTYDQFKQKFDSELKDGSVDFMLSPVGMRKMLSIHNV